MRHLLGTLALFALAACTPPQAANGPESVVRDLYAVTQENIGRFVTPMDVIPMTDDLRALVERAEAAAVSRDEPFIAGDIAANCQDCRSLSDLEIGAQEGPEPVPETDGHRMIEARFTLNGSEPRAVLYDLVETPEGWRIDNILAEGFNLRTEASAYLADIATDSAPAAEP